MTYMEFDALRAAIIDKYMEPYEDIYKEQYPQTPEGREEYDHIIKLKINAEIDALCKEFNIEDVSYKGW